MRTVAAQPHHSKAFYSVNHLKQDHPESRALLLGPLYAPAAMPTGQSHLDIALGALCALGGVMGYAKKKSTASLIGGLAFGGAYGATAYLINQVDAYQGHTLGAVSSAALLGVMGMRFSKTKKFMPAGLLASVGAIGLVYHWQRRSQWA